MSKNCKCKKISCESRMNNCEIICDNPCLLLKEPCNPCPQVKTVCFPVPYDPCNPCPPNPCYPCPPNPCYPCPPNPCYPCPPNPCPPKNNDLCPQYVVNNVIMTTNVTLTSQQVNSYNYFVFNGPEPDSEPITVTLPQISTLNNQGRKIINIVNISSNTLYVTCPDNMNGVGVITIGANSTLTLTSLPYIQGGAMWCANRG